MEYSRRQDLEEKAPSIIVGKESALCFRCNLFRVVTTFLSCDVSQSFGFALSQTDFYFKARGDRLYSAVRRRVYYLNSRISETSRSKTGFRWNAGSERASLCMQLCCMCQLWRLFFIQKKNIHKKITRQEIKICTYSAAIANPLVVRE